MRDSGGFQKAFSQFSFAATFCALLATSSPARSATLRLDSSPTGGCSGLPPVGDTFTAYVILGYNFGASATQFAIEMPPCAHYVITSWSVGGMLGIGDPVSGIFIAFGCTVGDVAVLELTLTRVGEPTDDCCRARIVAHPDAITGEPEIVDCSFENVVPAEGGCLWLNGFDRTCAITQAPSDPSPPDGATDVPLDVVLNAQVYTPDFCCPPLFGDWVNVYLGTDADPPLVGLQAGVPFDPESLSPGTKYYWKLVYHNTQAPSVSSPVWSFTTTNATPARTSTWGAVKALYR